MGFFGPLGSHQLAPRLLKIHVDRALAALGVPQEACILDAGCGSGLWSAYLLKRYPRARLLGIDIASERIAACRALGLGARASFEMADLHHFSSEVRFDLIVCMNAIHYAAMDDVAILMRLARLLSAEGRLLFVGPVAWSLQPLRGWSGAQGHPGYPGYTVEGLGAKTRAAGLAPVALRPIVGRLGTAAKEIAVRVQPHPVWKRLSYPALAALAMLDACFQPRERAYYLLGVFALVDGVV